MSRPRDILNKKGVGAILRFDTCPFSIFSYILPEITVMELKTFWKKYLKLYIMWKVK